MNKVVPMHGFGGGGALLNFEVVGGTTEPTNHKGNTIWVDTDQKITNWIFSASDPNMFDFKAWASGIAVGSGTKTYTDNSITITTGSVGDGHTAFSSNDTLSHIPVVAGKKYELSWVHSGNPGAVYIFPNAQITENVSASASDNKLEYVVPDGVTFVSFRVGVNSAYSSATFTDISFHEEGNFVQTGTVWVKTGTSETASFNALKKNSIMVYPISAVQRINGYWEEKPVKISRSGKWNGFIDWDAYLYRYDHPNNPSWIGLANTTVSINSEGILVAQSTTMSSHCAFGMAEAIDVTNVSAIRILYSSETNNGNNRFGVTTYRLITGDVNQYSTYVSAPTTGAFSTFKEVMLDVSALSGLVYLSGALVGAFHIKEVQKV